jgi:phage-related protein
MVAFYGPMLQGIWDFIVSVGNGIAAVWNAIWGGISSFFSGVWNGIVGFVNGAVNTVQAVIIGVVSAIQAGWNSTWSAIGSYFNQVWNNIVGWVQGFVRSVQDNVQNALDTVSRIGSNILNSVGDFGNLLYNSGADLIRGLANGITNMTDWVVSKVSSVGASVVDGLKNFFGIKSPSRLMRDQIGKQIGAGLAIGIEQSVDVVKKATQKLSDAAMMEVPDIQLPSIKAGSVIASGPSTAPLNRSSVFATDPTGQQNGSAFGQTGTGGVTNVNFQVNPSQGLNEQQIGEAAMEQLYWKLSTTSNP